MREEILGLLVTVSLVIGCASSTTTQSAESDGPGLPSVPAPVITREAKDALARMSSFLAGAKSLGFTTEVSYDVVEGDGQKIQYGSRAQATWTHPGQLRINVDGDERQNQIYFSDGRVTFLDKATNVYAVDPVEGGLDAALDRMTMRLQLRVPVADLMYSDPYATLMESAIWGRQVGLHEVRGTECIHLAFVAKGLDWQIWIDAAEPPLPRKLVIDYRDEPGSPTYTAVLTEWQIDPDLAEGFAHFSPPDGAVQVEFMLDVPGESGGAQ